MTKRNLRLCTLVGLFLALVAFSVSGATPSPKPNILYILADDLGWADVGFHGDEIKTPRLDQLAASGTRLEQFYVQPVCSPTRAAFLTGRYPIRLGLQVGVIRPWAQYGLPLDERTLPQALKEAGYATAISGKWHLGQNNPAYLPTHRGFDHQYGHYCGAIDYFTHKRNGGHDWHRDDRANYDQGYSTFLIAREAVRLLEAQDPAQPFFLYVPFNAVHAPHQVPEKYKEPYAHLKEPRRTYAGMVAAMDEAVGRIVDALDKTGLRRNTLILFSSDNGGPSPGRVTSNGPLRAGKGTLYEGGTRVPAFAAWEGHIPAGAIANEPMHMVDWYPTLLKLAGVSLEQKLPLDGRDIWPVITAGQPSPHDEILLNATPANGALRMGDWKLVLHRLARQEKGEEASTPSRSVRERIRSSSIRKAASERVELFNLARDPYEKTNLAEEYPDEVKRLRARFDALAKEAVPPRQAPPPPGFKTPKVWGE